MMYKTMPTMFLILLILISCGQGSMGLFFSLERVGAAEEESPPDSTITEESPPASTITEESPPAPTLTVGNTQLTVTWTEPLNDDGSAITEYHLRHREDGSDNWTVLNSGIGAHARSYTITELTNGAAYEVQVRAVNVL
ncbi:MAG: fibronectin type III domain-containing protein, partial [Salinispira sp.]